MTEKPRVSGLCWFRQEDYGAVRTMFLDGDKMPETWEKWLKQAEDMERRAKIECDTVERVYIDPATFPAWCVANDASVDSDGRHKFVAITLAEKYSRTH